MGVGRREFLRLTGIALTGLTIDPLQAVAVNDNVYVNKKLGILFEKPRDWGFIAVKDFGKLKDAQIIEDWPDKTREEIWEELSEPICVATKYFEDKPEFKGIFSPTITLNVEPKEKVLEDVGDITFEEMISMSEYGTSKVLKDFKVLKRYEPYLLSGCRFYEIDAEYMFEHVEMNGPLKVELKTLQAEHNGFYYDFNCHQSKAQNQLAGKEFEEFKKTIRLM